MMKHFTNLTPMKSMVVTTASDQPDVLVSAFERGGELVVHVLNTGAERDAVVSGLPPRSWTTVVTTETESFKESPGGVADDGRIHLPARSFITLVHGK